MEPTWPLQQRRASRGAEKWNRERRIREKAMETIEKREGGGFKEKRRERQRKSAAADGEGANNGGEKKESWQEWKNEGRVNRRSCTTPKLLWDQWVWSEVCVRARVCVYRSPRPPPPVVCLIKKKSLCVEGCWHPDGTKVCCRGSKTRGVDFYFRQSCCLWNELSGRRRSCDTGEDSGWCCIVIFGKKKKKPNSLSSFCHDSSHRCWFLPVSQTHSSCDFVPLSQWWPVCLYLDTFILKEAFI